MRSVSEECTALTNKMTSQEIHKGQHIKDTMYGPELWTDGLICAFEYVQVQKRSFRPRSNLKPARKDSQTMKKQLPDVSSPKESPMLESTPLNHFEAGNPLDDQNQTSQPEYLQAMENYTGSHWVPIGWDRISQLVQAVKVSTCWSSEQSDIISYEDDLTVADLAAPYWERPSGPIWWCHLVAGHPSVDTFLNNAHWLHPAVSIALRDESRLISERMKHLLYEIPVRVAGGLLFELLGQSSGDPYVDEDDIPVVLRSWQAQNFLLTVLHMKGSASSINVLGITEVQELLLAGCSNSPRSVHEVIAHLACRLARWDDRRNHEDLKLFSIILNQEIRRLSRQVIRVKWSLHAREEIVFELIQHLRGNITKTLLEGIRKSTREMIEEQEAVRGRLFTIQDVMQSTVRAWLQDRSLRVTHNLAVFGGCGLVLSIITGLFGINVDGIPGAQNTPYAFALFTALVVILGIVLISVGILYLGLKKPIDEEKVQVRKLELQELVKMFQHEAETHAKVRKNVSRHNLPPTGSDQFVDDANYVLIN
ncbi:uncharacterized protein LOC124936777 isoform X2 [Impatiens glandulifera]|uniref:uncharacterized protein LOC124936777 isoform X2 n=1 Tax=Impatiens glandulifera TaxID=253017 RepID=UPI001FB15ACB|nr:uncharacterized protein LOC124936777 isoform X2 [Impatiens glandulifera]